MSSLGHSLPKWAVHPMSAFPPIATIERNARRSRSCHERTHAAQHGLFFYHLVSASKQRGRDRDSQRLGSLEVDEHLVSLRLLHGEISGFRSAKDFVDVS